MMNRLPSGATCKKMVFAVAAALMALAVPAGAQTLTLTGASDTTLRGGAYANTNYGSSSTLELRAGSSDLTYERRILLKFDTYSTIPQGTTISSAKLTLTVKGGNSETRTIDAMPRPRRIPTSRRPGTRGALPPGGRKPAATSPRRPPPRRSPMLSVRR